MNMKLTRDLNKFQKALLNWFQNNKRILPWRDSETWYPVFLSEFLLQQTQVEQALPYFNRFIRQYPDIYDLADADEDEVLALWTGLGYYARARNMLKAARQIVQNHGGKFPEDHQQALELPGIGPYTAAAILSIAYGKPYPVVDGNVQRVITRLQSITSDLRSRETLKKINGFSHLLIDNNAAGSYNEAMMELGALICRPQNPLCSQCPVHTFCDAREKGIQLKLPVKSTKIKKKVKKQIVFAIQKHNQFLLVKRPAQGLLASMWEFPNVENGDLSQSEDTLKRVLKEDYGISGKVLKVSEPMKHTYSHFSLNYRPVLVQLESGECKVDRHVDWRWQDAGDFERLPLHGAHRKVYQWLKSLKIKTE
jgi:A/G-specific adenine glycosylase